MNTSLANFLISVASDPDKVAQFNNPSERNSLIDNSDLSTEDKDALKSGDVSTLLERLSAGPEELTWVLTPVGTGFGIAFGIRTGMELTGERSARARTASKTASRARKSAKRPAAKTRRRPKAKSRK
jgi:hypothetical protein